MTPRFATGEDSSSGRAPDHEKGGHCCPPVLEASAEVYFLQNPSLPFVTTTQFVSFSRPFIPVSAPVAGLMVSVLPLRVNSIMSPLAVPSNDFGPSALAISIEYLSPFFATLRYAPSAPLQRPTRPSTFEAVDAGLPVGDETGDAAGEFAGLVAGAGDAGGFVVSGVVFVHAAIAIPLTAKTVSKIDLLNLMIFMVMVRAVIFQRIDRLRDCGSFSRSSLYSGPAFMTF
jgi:hypothetical protein